MKKFIILLLAAVIVLLSACVAVSGSETQQTSQTTVNKTSGHRAANEKTLLKLKNFTEYETGSSFAEAAEFEEKECSLEINLPECAEQPFVKSEATKALTDFIGKELGTEISGKWLISVHYYDAEKTTGQIKLVYRINDAVVTNRAIIFFIEDGKIEKATYSYLDKEADETEITEKYRNFIVTHRQERKNPLGDGWSVDDETTKFVYSYKTGLLIYSYNIFLKNNESGIINNDYGTEVTVG